MCKQASCSDEGLTLETSAHNHFHGVKLIHINLKLIHYIDEYVELVPFFVFAKESLFSCICKQVNDSLLAQHRFFLQLISNCSVCTHNRTNLSKHLKLQRP